MMQPFKWPLVSLVLISAAFCAALGIYYNPGHTPSHQAMSFQPMEHKYPLRIAGFKITNFEAGALQSIIAADELKINRRKFFVFQFNPITECTVNNLALELYDCKGGNLFESIETGLLSGETAPLCKAGGTEFGLITRGVVNGLDLRLFRTARPWLTIKAEKAVIDFKNAQTALYEVAVTDIEAKRLIQSRSAKLDNKTGLFKIQDTTYPLSVSQTDPNGL